MAPKTYSTLCIVICFLACSLVAVVAEAKAPMRDGADPQQLQDAVTTAWASTSGLACSASGMVSDLLESQSSLFHIFGAGVAVASMLACTLYCAYLYLDPQPYLFNNGKLGPLEARSIYVNKKSC